MRIADKMALTQVTKNLSKNRYEMSELQNQAATQKRINKPSDDPLGAARVLEAKSDEAQQNQFIKSLNIAKGFLDYTDQSLGELSELIVRAKELAVGQSGDSSANEETRRVAATEIEQLISQSIQIGNRKLGERYIFGGYKTTAAPFDRSGNYFGDKGEVQIQVNKDSFITMNVPGHKPFLGEGFSEGSISENRQRVPKSAEDLLQNIDQRQKSSEIDKQEENPFRVYSGQGRGLASVQSTTSLERERASANNPDLDSEAPIRDENSTGVNLFDTLRGLSVSLKTNSKDGVQESLDILDHALDQVIVTRSQVGARVMALNNSLESLQKSQMDSRIKASQMEDADVLQLVTDINKTESALRSTLETSGKLIQPSLLDFIK